MEFIIESTFQIFQMVNKALDFGDRQEVLKNIHQSFNDIGSANEWIYDNGETDVDYTILEVQRKKRVG